jgi:spermidine/putrescine transport system permease protein
MRLYAAAVYVFLYAPIFLIVLFSFNAGRHASDFTCCSADWYGRAYGNPFILEALGNSLIIAGTTAVLATLMGTMAALALQRVRGWLRVLFDALTYTAIIIPGIVIGIATLVALVTLFDFLNPLLQSLWPTGPETAPRLGMGYGSVIAAHTLFTMALVIVIVRTRIQGMDRSLIEASADLYASPWRTFRQVTLPQLFPAVLSGFLLSFTFSFDLFLDPARGHARDQRDRHRGPGGLPEPADHRPNPATAADPRQPEGRRGLTLVFNESANASLI